MIVSDCTCWFTICMTLSLHGSMIINDTIVILEKFYRCCPIHDGPTMIPRRNVDDIMTFMTNVYIYIYDTANHLLLPYVAIVCFQLYI